MQAKKSIERGLIQLLGIVLAVGNGYIIFTQYLLVDKYTQPSHIFIQNFLYDLALFPSGLPPLAYLINQGGAVVVIVALWQTLIMLCGLGLFWFYELARRTVVIMCILHFFLFLMSVPVSYGIYKIYETSAVFGLDDVLTLIVPVVYIVFLFNRKVTEWFIRP